MSDHVGLLEVLVPDPGQRAAGVGCKGARGLTEITLITLSYTEHERNMPTHTVAQVTHEQTANIILFYSYGSKTVCVRDWH